MTGLRLRVELDAADAVAATGATIRRRLSLAIARQGRAALALSGGSTGSALVGALAAAPDIRGGWRAVTVWQVDERVAPDGDPARNATALGALAGLGAELRLMPVTAPDLPVAAAAYARSLPERLDVVHLGVGDDGHTASWPPADPIVDQPAARRVAISGVFNGRVRMSLLPATVNAAGSRVALVTGADKADAVAAWVEGAPFDADLPVRLVRRAATTLIVDRAAASKLTRSVS
ncbi:MAG: 6-phosphogluconolactonase [Desertimonas sp.]